MEARIDYLRFWLPFKVQERVDEMNEYETLALEILKQHNIPGKPFQRITYNNRHKGRVDSSWNIWGVAADLFLAQCTPVMLKKLTRIDYRGEFSSDDLDFDGLFSFIKEKHKGQMTVTQISSPIRRKKGPMRDLGGEGIIVGATESKNRLTIYKRAEEGPHIEAQFTGDTCQQIIYTAMGNGEMIAETVYDSVKEAAAHYFSKVVQKRVGMTPDELDSYTAEFNDRVAYQDPEYILYKMDGLFDLLPQDAQEAVVEGLRDKLGIEPARPIAIVDWEPLVDRPEFEVEDDSGDIEYPDPERNPEEEDWDEWIDESDDDDNAAHKREELSYREHIALEEHMDSYNNREADFTLNDVPYGHDGQDEWPY